MEHPVVLLTDNDLGDRDFEAVLLKKHIPEVEVVVASCRTESDVLEAARSHQPHAIVTQWAPVTAAVLDEMSRCRIISRVGIGLDMIDLTAAEDRGIEVLNVPHYCTEEVATHAVAMALALWRRLPEFDAEVREGRWSAAEMAPRIGRLSEASLGLIGAGRIGSLVATVFQGMGARVMVHDPDPSQNTYEMVYLEELAARSDVISLHAPLTGDNHHVVGADLLRAMERRPILVNTSRGGLVDLDAVNDALVSGHLAGAGLDVFEDEPLDMASPILERGNTILTPHAAWCSSSALPELRRESILNIVRCLTPDERGTHDRT